VNLTYTASLLSMYQMSCIFSITSVVPNDQSRPEARVSVSREDQVLRWWVVSTSPTPQAGGPLLVCCPRRIVQCIPSYPPYWRPFLHRQPEDAACRGDRDPQRTRHAVVTGTHRGRGTPWWQGPTEDAACRGDRDPLTMDSHTHTVSYFLRLYR
jgi:hypothetical protein